MNDGAVVLGSFSQAFDNVALAVSPVTSDDFVTLEDFSSQPFPPFQGSKLLSLAVIPYSTSLFRNFVDMRLTALLLRHCHLQAAWRAATHHHPHPHPHPHQFLLHRTTTSLLSFTSRILSRTMSSDADYEAFLRRSQKDYSASYEGSNHAAAAGTISIQVENNPHPAIKALGERFYTSDVDEPFEGISFKWQKESLPTAGT
jgi:hypothetical protein